MNTAENADIVKEARLAFDRSLGINSRYMTEAELNTEGIGFVMRPDGNGRLVRRETNGLFDTQKNVILYNPDNDGELFTGGHEITHWMRQNHPDVYAAFRDFVLSDLTAQKKQEIRNAAEPEIEEFIADRMGEILQDGVTLQLTARKAEKFQAGFGTQFLTVVQEYARKVVDFLKQHPSLNGAAQYFKHYSLVREAAASALAELRKHSLQPKRAYYEIPFDEGLKRAVDPAQRNMREPVFVSETPEVFRNIGFTALPIMMNVRHLRMNYYNPQEFRSMFGTMRVGEHAHGLHTYLNGLPNALKYPLAVVANLTPNAKPGSVVAITNMDVAGKKVVVPVLIEATSQADNQNIDAHLVLTVYDSNDWREKFLYPALEAEKNGVGVFYFDPKKAGQYSAYSNRIGTIPSGYVHNITDPGSPVKGNFKKQTETLQFMRWFGGSKVVDKDGKPLVVYHGTDWDMMNEPAGKAVFDQGKIGQNFFQSLGGFFFTSRKETAANYGESVEGFYLSMKNPLIVQPPVMRSAIEYFDWERGNLVREAEARGCDGIIVDGMNYDIPKYRQKLFVVFSPNQIKSASQNIGTFDIRNPDVRYSVSVGSEKKSEKNHDDDLLSPKMSIGPVSPKKETAGSMKMKM